MPVAAKPGAASGKAMRRKALHTPQPSIHAASSNDRGTAAKNPRIDQITSARLNVT